MHDDELSDHIAYWALAFQVFARRMRGEPTDAALLAARASLLEERQRTRRESIDRMLRVRLGLDAHETGMIWALATIALDRHARAAVADLSESAGSIAIIGQVVYGDRARCEALRALGPSGALQRYAIIERVEGAAAETWQLARRMLPVLHGDLTLDPALATFASRCDTSPRVDALAVDPTAVVRVDAALRGPGTVLVATGIPGLGRRTLLVTAARAVKLDVLQIDCRRLAREEVPLRKQLRALARECRLLGCVPLLAALDALGDERYGVVGEELVSDLHGHILATSGPRRPSLAWDRPVIAIELAHPTSEQREQLWHVALGVEVPGVADRYPLAPAIICRAAVAARACAVGRAVTIDEVAAGIRSVLDDRLGDFARRLVVTQTWDDLVLPREERHAIAELVARIRHRRRVYEEWAFAAKLGKGLGVSALFSGPPGTGKTMVAGLIARELGLDIYQVDLAKLVSKWLGETEQHLAAIFDAADAGHAILLFDEADTLFGKRTEVRSSNDRYANLETNYLLQRLESFTGICLLTTNHETYIDPAFQRRLSIHVRFELPDAAERARLWKAMLPAAAPTSGVLEFGSLANRFVMSGGSIRNAVLRAAFLAAAENAAIGMRHLEVAARVEYGAIGKLVGG